MTALQSIIKEAKAIRKKNPKMEWKKAVAQASAIYASKHKGKSPIGKKHVKKKAAKKKAVGVIKKKAIRKTATKRVKRKPTEKTVLKSIKKAVSVQKAHMSGMGKVDKKLFHSLTELKAFHKEQGGHWFDRNSMKYFNTKIESSLIAGKYFIYSNKMPYYDRYYKIAEAYPSGNIFPVENTPSFDDKLKAKEYLLKKILKH
jgi:hypothetical protein